jgi:hypothetical protein
MGRKWGENGAKIPRFNTELHMGNVGSNQVYISSTAGPVEQPDEYEEGVLVDTQGCKTGQ